VKSSLNRQGQIVSLIENLPGIVPAIILSAQITEREALDAALKRHYPGLSLAPIETERRGDRVTFAKGDSFSEDFTVTRVVVPMADNSMQEGYLVVTWDSNNVLRHTLVGRNGDVLDVEIRTNNDSYNIFPNNPGVTPQTIVSGPSSGNLESPSGWVFSNTTTGNNVDAYLDRDNNNAPDVNGRPVSSTSTQDFVTTANLSDSPTTADNQKVAVQNLFYLNNVIHDKLYKHGFTETAGNFQEDNFGKGGAGSDSVSAEAQDGGGTNNANFATPADGSNPKMQMYLWTNATPNRDGDLDSDIVWHEYGHGLTWRMIGGMSGPLAGAIGEGMGDALAILINNNDRVAEYSYNNSVGIRRFPYTGYPNTYGDVTGASVHNDGEIYAATIWRLSQLWQQNSLSQDLLFDYLIDGMDFTPSRPAYEDMRDGILSAVTDQSHECLVWDAFAQFGIGVGADGRESCLGPFCSVSITESFQKPAVCTGAPQSPAAPSNLTANAVSASQVNLSWTDNSGDEANFRIERCSGTGCNSFSEIAQVNANIVSFSDNNVSASTPYSYRVRSYNTNGYSDYSNTSQATTQSPPSTGKSHIGDLDGSRNTVQGGNWKATVTITVHNQDHAVVSGATVSGSWSGGFTGSGSCTTQSNGQCSLTTGTINKKSNSVNFSVTGVAHATLAYLPPSNHDPESDSNGTNITILKP
jgi:hypothetical protein